MRRVFIFVLAVLLIVAAGCSQRPKIQLISSLTPTRTPRPLPSESPTPEPIQVLPVDDSGTTIGTRYNSRPGYTRDSADPGSIGEFLRGLPLKAAGASVTVHDGTEREDTDYAAVIDWSVIDKNEQAAGATARVFVEYFYSEQEMDAIVLTMNDGFKFAFSEWAKGQSIRVNSSNKLTYTGGGTTGEDRSNFEKYLAACYKWSGLDSLLSSDLVSVPESEPIRAGDVFAAGGDVKYAIVVADTATDEQGNQQVMLISGDKPAQQLRLWANPLDTVASPWFTVDMLNDRIDTGREGVTLSIESRYRFKNVD